MFERASGAARRRQYGELFLFLELAFNNKNMQDLNKEQNKKWWEFRKMSSKDYGHIMKLCLPLVVIRAAFPQMGPLLGTLFDILITFGLIAFVWWLIEKIKSRSKKS